MSPVFIDLVGSRTPFLFFPLLNESFRHVVHNATFIPKNSTGIRYLKKNDGVLLTCIVYKHRYPEGGIG